MQGGRIEDFKNWNKKNAKQKFVSIPGMSFGFASIILSGTPPLGVAFTGCLTDTPTDYIGVAFPIKQNRVSPLGCPEVRALPLTLSPLSPTSSNSYCNENKERGELLTPSFSA